MVTASRDNYFVEQLRGGLEPEPNLGSAGVDACPL